MREYITRGMAKFMEYDDEFNNTFGGHVNHFIDKFLVSVGFFSFDIISFDEWIQKKNPGQYRTNKESLKMFITRLYGNKAMELIDKLIVLK